METKTFEVEIYSVFTEKEEARKGVTPKIREVVIPADQLNGNPLDDLERVYYYGQNDFQPRNTNSVSVGDVVRYNGKRYIVGMAGFIEVKEG